MTLGHTETHPRPSALAAASAVPWGRNEAADGPLVRSGGETTVAPPPQWASTLRQLAHLAPAPVPPPLWWTPRTALCGNVETWTNPSSRWLEGMSQPAPEAPPAFCFIVGLAGWGHFDGDDGQAQTITPGQGCFTLAPSRHRYHLPPGSPGWTFAWIGIQNPLMVARVADQVEAIGPIVELEPEQSLIRVFLRLARGAVRKDFRDRFELELAMWEFVLTYERWAHEQRDGSSAGRQRLLDEVRVRIVAGLPRAIGVETLAADYGMSRSHFSHFFRARTGLTPAHYAIEVRIDEATRLLRETRAPLKAIANACGFANANYFSKVFRRYQHLSPPAYRRATV
jgi:AraC-like DNA-binding protein